MSRSRQRPVPSRRAGPVRRGVTHLLVIALAAFGPGTSAVLAQAAAPDVATAIERLTVLRDGVDRIEATLPDALWTAEELGFELAFEDAATIAAWVRDEVAYQAYRGVLRGGDGTLQARAGNALDQALLLAGLLYDAGYEARIARAALADDAAQALLASVRTPELPAFDPSAARDAYAEAGLVTAEQLAQAAAEGAEAEARLFAEAEETAAWLRATLAEAGHPLGGATVDDALADARDYAWVQARLGSDEPWQDLHPAAPEGAGWTADLEPASTLEGDIPSDLQHRFRFRAVVERRLGDELEVNPIMSAWERPVANLNGVALSYVSMPDGFLEGGPGTSPAEAYAETSLVAPVFNDALAGGARLFDLLGNAVPTEAAQSPMAGVFGNVADALGDATSALSGEEDAVALTAHWLEFTFVEPGGDETTYRRMVVDRLGPERRASGDASGPLEAMSDEELYQALMTRHTFMVAPGRTPAAYVGQRSVRGLREAADYLAALYETSAENAPPPEPSDALAQEIAAGPLLRALEAFDDAPFVAPEGTVAYRARPSLLVASARWDGATVSTDVIQNARRTLAVGPGDDVRADAGAALRAGVWESTAERLALIGRSDALPPDRATRLGDTTSFFRAVRDQGVEVRTLAPGARGEAAGLELPEASRAAIADDLEAGYAVVAPASMPQGEPVAAWWRVDPVSGETLGRGGDGRGQVTAEYVTVGFSIFTGLVGFGMCMTGENANVGCCITDGVTGAAGGWLISSLFAAAAASAAASLIFDAHALAVGTAGLSWCLLEGAGPTNDAPAVVASGGAPGVLVAGTGPTRCGTPALRPVATVAVPTSLTASFDGSRPPVAPAPPHPRPRG